MSRFWPALLACLLVAGCSILPGAPKKTPVDAFRGVEPVRHFQLEGRLSVKTEAQRVSGGLSWRRAAAEETLLFSAPLGQGAAEIRRQGGALVLTGADGAIVSAASDELLLEKAIGLRLPLEGLVYWMSALPRPGVAYRAEQDGDGRVGTIEQDGWRIEYDRYRRLGERMVPGRIFARRGEDMEFRLVVDAWEAK